MGSCLSIYFTLNGNGLNAPTKRHRLAGWIQKQNPYICCLQEIDFMPMDPYRLKVRGWEKVFHTNRKHKKAGVAIHISYKIDFKTKMVMRQRKALYNDQAFNPRRYNNYKLICTQHRSTLICMANTNKHKCRN